MRRFILIALALSIAGCHDDDDDDDGFLGGAWPTDFNHDGYADILVGAPLEDQGGTDRGAVYLYAGGPSVDGTEEEVYTIAEDLAHFGAAVAAIGDHNGDGYPDFAIGAPLEDVGGTNRGRVYVYLGGPSFPTTWSYTIDGTEDNGQFGLTLARAGDVDGSGADELLVGAPAEDAGGTDRGRVYLYRHGTTPAIATFSGGENGAQFGQGLTGAGDMNQDGFYDWAIGAPEDDGDGNTTDDALDVGRVFVYFGSNTPDNAVDRVLTGTEEESDFGFSIAGLNDWSSDGYGDLAVGAPGDDGDDNATEDNLDVGRCFVYLGGATVDTTADLTITGAEAGGGFGNLVARIGDIDNGGPTELLVGAHMDDADGNATENGIDTGRAFLYLGAFGGGDDVADATFTGAEDSSDFGWTGFSGGDVDGDGYRDIVIGAPLDDNDGNTTENGVDAGRAFLYFGGPAMNTVADLALDAGSEADGVAGTSVQ